MEFTLSKTINYLTSNDQEYVKLACFVLKRYFLDLFQQNEKEYINVFISSAILDHIANILRVINDPLIIVNTNIYDLYLVGIALHNTQFD